MKDDKEMMNFEHLRFRLYDLQVETFKTSGFLLVYHLYESQELLQLQVYDREMRMAPEFAWINDMSYGCDLNLFLRHKVESLVRRLI